MIIILSEGIKLLPVLLAATAFIAVPFISMASAWVTTLIHEVGHGIITIPFGGKPRIKVSSDGSGEAITTHPDSLLFKPVRILSLLMGYAFPVYVGISLLIVAYYNMPIIGAWILGILGIILTFSIRNLFGFLLVVVYNIVFFAFFIMNNFLDDIVLIVFMGLVLLGRGIIDIIFVSFFVFSRDDDVDETDFHLLQEESLFPPQFWYIVFIIFHTSIIITIMVTFFPVSFML